MDFRYFLTGRPEYVGRNLLMSQRVLKKKEIKHLKEQINALAMSPMGAIGPLPRDASWKMNINKASMAAWAPIWVKFFAFHCWCAHNNPTVPWRLFSLDAHQQSEYGSLSSDMSQVMKNCLKNVSWSSRICRDPRRPRLLSVRKTPFADKYSQMAGSGLLTHQFQEFWHKLGPVFRDLSV